MRAQLRINSLYAREGREAAAFLPRVVEAIDRVGLWDDYALHSPPSQAIHPAQPWGRVASELQREPEGTHEIFADSDDRNACILVISETTSKANLTQTYAGRFLEEHCSRLLDVWVDLVSSLVTVLNGDLWFGPTLQVQVHDLPYWRARPPRSHRSFGPANIVDFFSRDFHNRHPDGMSGDLARIEAAELPAGVKREARGDLLILRWVESLAASEAAISQSLSTRDEWLSRVLHPPIAPGWNEAGDEQVFFPLLKPHAPLTLYDSMSSTGILAVVVDEAGQGADAELGELTHWTKVGALPDGTKIRSTALMVPSRERALAVRERALSLGIQRVFYPGDNGSIWTPFPSGNWKVPGQ